METEAVQLVYNRPFPTLGGLKIALVEQRYEPATQDLIDMRDRDIRSLQE